MLLLLPLRPMIVELGYDGSCISFASTVAFSLYLCVLPLLLTSAFLISALDMLMLIVLFYSYVLINRFPVFVVVYLVLFLAHSTGVSSCTRA